MTLVAIDFALLPIRYSIGYWNRTNRWIKILLNMEDDLMGAGYNVNQSK